MRTINVCKCCRCCSVVGHDDCILMVLCSGGDRVVDEGNVEVQ